MKKFYIFFIIFFAVFFGCERPTEINEGNDEIPPAVPDNFSVYYASDGEIILEWRRNREPDLKGFNIYRKINTDEYNFLIFVTDDFYIDDSLEYFNQYSYKISAVDYSGNESETTYEVSAVPLNKFSPVKPLHLSINGRNWPDEISISLNWSPNSETDLAGYNIYRGNSPSFQADSNSFIGFSSAPFYKDTAGLIYYKEYYYKIRAIDKGGLLSEESGVISDKILEVPEMIFPYDNYQSVFFDSLKIKTLDVPATYKLIVQENQFFGEVWSYLFSTSVINETLSVALNARNLSYNKRYYWRVITYSGNSTEPNSVSGFKSFILTP